MKRLLPLLLALLGLGAGVGAGHVLQPEPEEAATAEVTPPEPAVALADPPDPLAGPALSPEGEASFEYYRLDGQFVVPVMAGEEVGWLVVLTLSLEIEQGGLDGIYALEPRLRDSFLRTLFAHERAGGFQGIFTGSRRLGELRASLRGAAREVLGPIVSDVLITEIVRQQV
ncbi:MAG: flagellar basal body-associated FliL family protein [Pseudomonadota bacterium]